LIGEFQLCYLAYFDSITVKDITELATINRATFYAHFVDKYMLLEVLFLEVFDQTLAERKIDDRSFRTETLENIILAMCDFFKLIKKECKKISSSVMSLMEEKIINRIATLIKQIVQQSDDSKDHFSEEMELSIAMVSWSIYGIAFKWSTTGSFSQKELAAKSASLIQNGTNELLFTRSVMG
jgi:AcrR family transcriptional regulator